MARTERIYPRLPCSITVEYDGFERSYPDRILNLSCKGAFVFTPKPLPVGRRVTLRFSLPELPLELVEARGSVAWVPGETLRGPTPAVPMGMGIRFDPSDRDLFHLLDQYVTVLLGLRHLDTRIGKELRRAA